MITARYDGVKMMVTANGLTENDKGKCVCVKCKSRARLVKLFAYNWNDKRRIECLCKHCGCMVRLTVNAELAKFESCVDEGAVKN